ncbi:MAG: DUF3015 family protein [Nitrospiraceae bacterium]
MKHSTHPIWTAICMSVLSLLFSACTLRGTTESVSDTTQNTTVSTSGRSWVTVDGMIRSDQRAIALATTEFENLQEDMARGRGEYLASLGSLLGVTTERQEDFFRLTKETYPALIASGSMTPDAMLAVFHTVTANPMVAGSSPAK